MAFSPEDQARRFESVDLERLQWILDTSHVFEQEKRVFDAAVLHEGPTLEVGAGEALLPRFRPEVLAHGYFGLDLHQARARETSRAFPSALGIRADAGALPFASGAMKNVVIRDVLHHLPVDVRTRCVAECARTLCDDGTVTIIEPNASRHFIMWLFSAAIKTERLALGFNADKLSDLVTHHFGSVRVRHLMPSALYRLVLHYKFGRPSLNGSRPAMRALRAWESLISKVPERYFGYVCLTCQEPKR